MLIDPRHGDIEDDAASPGQRSLLAIAGSLLVALGCPSSDVRVERFGPSG